DPRVGVRRGENHSVEQFGAVEVGRIFGASAGFRRPIDALGRLAHDPPLFHRRPSVVRARHAVLLSSLWRPEALLSAYRYRFRSGTGSRRDPFPPARESDSGAGRGTLWQP